MSEAIRNFKTALEEENEQQAIETAGAFLDTIDRRSNFEQGIETASRRVALDDAVPANERSLANDVLQQIREIENTRLALAQDVAALANGLVEFEDTFASVEKLERQKKELEEAREAFRATEAVQDLSPILLALEEDQTIETPAGKSIKTEVTIQNAGGTAATEVTITPTNDGVELDVKPSKIGRLTATDTDSVILTGPDDLGSGRYRTKIIVDSAESAQDVLGFSIFILSKTDYLQEVIDLLDEFETRIEEILDHNRRPVRPFRQNIEKIRSDLQSLIKKLDDGKIGEQRANKQIEKNRRRLNSLYGLVKSLDRIRDAITAALITDLDSIDEKLELAQEAAI